MKKFLSMLLIMLSVILMSNTAALAYYYGPTWDTGDPVSVYIPQGEKYSNNMLHAFQKWQSITSNRLKFEYVNDEEDASIVVNFVDEVDGEDGDIGSYSITVQGNKIKKAEINIVNNKNKKHNNDMMYTTMLHEIGHVIGLSDSGRSFGIMHTPVSSTQDIVQRDVIMLYKLYGWSTMPNGVYKYEK